MKSKKKKLVLTAALRVKNEEQNLPRCLANLERFCDHIVAYDDGSTDRTLEILNSHPKVRHVVSMPKGYFHEAIDRSVALALAALTKPDWIVRIDPDEVFEEQAVQQIRSVLALDDFKAWSLRRFNCVGDEDHGDLAEEHWCFFRYVPGKVFYFNLRVHCVVPCLDQVPGKWGEVSLRVRHFGYVNKEEKLAKSLADGYHFGPLLTPYFHWEEKEGVPLLIREVPRPLHFFYSQDQIDHTPVHQKDHQWNEKRFPNLSPEAIWVQLGTGFNYHFAPLEAAQALGQARAALVSGGPTHLKIGLCFAEGLQSYINARWTEAEVVFKEVAMTCQEIWPFMACHAEAYQHGIKLQQAMPLRYPRDPQMVDIEALKEKYLAWFVEELVARKPEKVFLFGAGHHTITLDGLGFFNRLPVEGIIDDSPIGKVVNKVPVMSLDEAKKRGPGIIIVSTDYYEPQVVERLKKADLGGALLQPIYFTMGEEPFWFNERKC